jgi:hypothetical protein
MTTKNTYGIWDIYPGNDPNSLALPDYFSTYLAYTYDTSLHPNTRLRITGDFPYAQYMSFNIYPTRSGTSLGGMTDFQIRTQSPNVNPFVAGSDEQAQARQYVMTIESESDADDGQQLSSGCSASENLITYNPADIKVPGFPEQLLTVIIRYYVPVNERGGVEPPTVEVLNMDDTPLVPQPTPYPTFMDLNEPIFRHRLSPIFQSTGGDALRFYHSVGGGQFNNADNLYLISAVEGVDGESNVVILRVMPPTFPRTNEDFDKVAVRYWSFNQGNPNTSTPIGMRDGVFRPAMDGFIYLVMGGESVRVKAHQGGYNYLPWQADKEQAVILYRNMLTNPQYRGSILRVPELPKAPWDEAQLVEYEASQYLGDYAPVGRKVTAQEFNDSYGGMPSPGFAPLPH